MIAPEQYKLALMINEYSFLILNIMIVLWIAGMMILVMSGTVENVKRSTTEGTITAFIALPYLVYFIVLFYIIGDIGK